MQTFARTGKSSAVENALFPSEKILLAIGVTCLCASALLFGLALDPPKSLTAQIASPAALPLPPVAHP